MTQYTATVKQFTGRTITVEVETDGKHAARAAAVRKIYLNERLCTPPSDLKYAEHQLGIARVKVTKN